MRISELRAMLKGLKGADEIMIDVPSKGKNYLYGRFQVYKDENWKCYKIKILC